MMMYFSLICDPFPDPIISLHSQDIALYDCHIQIYLPGPPQTNWTRISKMADVYLEVRKRRGYIFLNETSACGFVSLIDVYLCTL
jgi:hypothetical protein